MSLPITFAVVLSSRIIRQTDRHQADDAHPVPEKSKTSVQSSLGPTAARGPILWIALARSWQCGGAEVPGIVELLPATRGKQQPRTKCGLEAYYYY